MGTIALPPRAVTGPALSREFLSADDAARYAHEQVGTRRDRGYTSCIFKRYDGRFVVSEPVAIIDESLDSRLLYPQNALGKSVFPREHVLHSLFYSHVALSMLDVQAVANRRWNSSDAATSLLMFSVRELRFLLEEQLTAYVSGAQDSLLLFKPDPARTASLREQLGSTEEPGALAKGLESGAFKPGKLVVQTAAAGGLEVIISNGHWRPRGVIPGYSIMAPSWARTVPKRIGYRAIYPTADEAAQDSYLHETLPHGVDQVWFGFILKHKGKEQYIATELVPLIKDQYVLFSLSSLFPASGIAGGYRFPDAFAVHSYIYSRPRVRHAEDNSKNWLAHNFIEPRNLFVAIYNSKKHPQVESGASISTYISPMEGALLKYTPRKDTRLFDNDMPLMGLEEIQNNLASGILSSTDFVRLVANSGELNVLRTNLCWDCKGLVDRYWFASRSLQRLALGPVFRSADDAAVHARQQIASSATRSYGGLILRRADNLFVATVPIGLFEEDFGLDFIFPDASVTHGAFPAGCTIVGRYRSRVARELPILMSAVGKQVYLNMLSADVVCTAFQWASKRLEEYLFCPDGAIIRYYPDVREKLVHGLLIKLGLDAMTGLKPAKIKQKVREGWLLPEDWVKKLLGYGKLEVVVGSKLWGQPGTVSHFVPFPGRVANAGISRDPVCSPLFTQEAAAARYFHEKEERSDRLHFGAILMSLRSKQFLASQPMEVQDDNLQLLKIFPEGSLPYRHVLQGLYLRAPRHPSGLGDQDYRHFFSPLDVSRAHAIVSSAQGYKPVFFSCADGALLRYEMSPFDVDAPLDKFGQFQLLPNPFASLARAHDQWQKILRGTFELDRYIRQMAKAGKLEVLIPSAFWSRVGVVGADWMPRMADVSLEDHWANKPELALGPVFHHADDAARYAQERAGSAYEQEAVYESAILFNNVYTAYVALEPVVENDDMHTLERIFRRLKDSTATPRNKPPRFPTGFTLVAGHQLYASGNTTLTDDPEAVYANYASPAMVFAHTFALKAKGFDIKAHYYSTPHGALIKYVPGYSEAERRLLTTRPAEVIKGQWITRLSPGAFISQLSSIAELRVLKAAHYWNQEGRLGSDWRVSRQQEPAKIHRMSRDEL
jgi:hypothetical protein